MAAGFMFIVIILFTLNKPHIWHSSLGIPKRIEGFCLSYIPVEKLQAQRLQGNRPLFT